MKKVIILMQWLATLVSGFMNRLFLSPTVYGLENLFKLAELQKQTCLSVIFISNHINANDPFVQTAFLPACVKAQIFPITFLTDYEKFGGKIKSFCMKTLGCIPVGNGKGENVRETIKRIKNGQSIYLFPEGRVSLDGEFGKDQGALEYFNKFSTVIVQPICTEGLKPFWDFKSMLMMKRKLCINFAAPFVLEKGSKIDAMQVVQGSMVVEKAKLVLEA